MKIRIHGIHLDLTAAKKHCKRVGKPIIAGVLFSERERGLYRVSPNGDYTYIQPLPRRFTKENTFRGA